jgi:pantoate--beta-alanine ligase
MKVVHNLKELWAARGQEANPLGLVPTMGYLHEGHLSLVRRARARSASVAVSIYVNPTQFGPGEDLSTYPRAMDRDLALLESEGVDLVWVPADDELYPPGFQTWVEVQDLTQHLEGEHRPGHFRGVTTIVAKLFAAFQPQLAFFGQKDAQQAIVLQRMVKDLNFPIELEICPIVREADGLALSSRNSYLDPEERRAAVVLSRSLFAAETAYGNGEREAEALRKIVHGVLDQEEAAQPVYVSAADLDTLEELEGLCDRILLSIVVRIGKTRLIDNVMLIPAG